MLLPPPKQELLPPIPHGDGEPELWPCWRDSGFVNASVCAVFQPNQSPLITGTGVKPAKRSRSWNGGDTQPEPCQELNTCRDAQIWPSALFCLREIPGLRTQTASFTP